MSNLIGNRRQDVIADATVDPFGWSSASQAPAPPQTSWVQYLESQIAGEFAADELEAVAAKIECLKEPEEIIALALETARDLLALEVAAYFTPSKAPALDGRYVLAQLDRQARPELQAALERDLYFPGHALADGPIDLSTNDSADALTLPILRQLGLNTMLTAPVRDRSGVIGLLAVMNFGDQPTITLHRRGALEALARRVGQALERLRLETWLKLTVVSGWPAVGLALEEVRYEPEGHTERVARLAAAQGRANGLDAGSLRALRQGAYLHDVGKLALPEEVVLKTGSLNALEWSVMHTHPERGARLVERSLDCSPGALEVIRHHHEHWDGSGYPDRLRGEAIPLAARIFAVCDVYDSLTSRQLYRSAWTVRTALDEILVQSGKHFDPQVVETFLEMAVGHFEGTAVRS